MSRTDLRTILFDFFGTLVDYNPSRTGQGFPETHRIIGEMGGHLSYEEFVAVWDRTFSEYERRTALDDREFSMTDVATSVLAAAVDGPVRADEIEALIEVYLAEWSAGVRYLDDVAPLLADLSGDYRLGVLTNTHSAGLVPGHLAAMGSLRSSPPW